jgi:hypothetical protein
MKKKNLTSLKLNKKLISDLKNTELAGGTGNITDVFDCPSILVKPHCFSRPSDYSFCNCPSAIC